MKYPIETCVVDGCDRGPFENEAAYRGHINGSAKDGHDWKAVQDQLSDQPTTSEEGGESGDGDNDSDSAEGGTEGDDPTPEGDETGENGSDEADMPTQDEYEQQHDTSEDGGESGDDDNDATGSDTSGSPLASLPMNPKTLGMLLAVALILWLSYRALAGSSDEDQPTTSGEQAEIPDGSTTDDQPAGGLTG